MKEEEDAAADDADGTAQKNVAPEDDEDESWVRALDASTSRQCEQPSQLYETSICRRLKGEKERR